MNHRVKLIGLDFGTTTSSAVIASARLCRNAVTGRMDLSDVRECARSELVFTPLRDDHLDLVHLEQYLDEWLTQGAVRSDEIFGGGALLTGLTARQDNAPALAELIRRRLGNALVASADDPCLESWLAFMGSCAELSRAHPETPILNLDIGGGTTNLALGKAGEVLSTGCLFVGARHVQVEPGTYRIVRLSEHARKLFAYLGVLKGPGASLSEVDLVVILDFYVNLLDTAVAGRRDAFETAPGRLHEQVRFRLPANVGQPLVTFSGGVGELIYRLEGGSTAPTTSYGDLGIDLAQRLLRHGRWAQDVRRARPASGGRATVYGLLRHSTEVSGSTLFLPRPEMLPLTELPIIGSLGADSSDEYARGLLDLVRRSPRGGCLHVRIGGHDAAAVRKAARKIRDALAASSFPVDHPLVLLLRENVGKVLGQYVSAWGTLPLTLLVIDELTVRDAQYAQVGAMREQVVPVSLYGLEEKGTSP